MICLSILLSVTHIYPSMPIIPLPNIKLDINLNELVLFIEKNMKDKEISIEVEDENFNEVYSSTFLKLIIRTSTYFENQGYTVMITDTKNPHIISFTISKKNK
jgi:hypothetical protein